MILCFLLSLVSAAAGLFLGYLGHYEELPAWGQMEFGMMVASLPALTIACIQMIATIVAVRCHLDAPWALGTLTFSFCAAEFFLGYHLWPHIMF